MTPEREKGRGVGRKARFQGPYKTATPLLALGFPLTQWELLLARMKSVVFAFSVSVFCHVNQIDNECPLLLLRRK